MTLYIIAIALLAIGFVFFFCAWIIEKHCVKFWNMMYREEQKRNDYLYGRVKRLEDKYILSPRSRDNMQSFVDSLGTPRPQHEPGDDKAIGKALAEEPAPYYALDMMAKSQPKEEPHD